MATLQPALRQLLGKAAGNGLKAFQKENEHGPSEVGPGQATLNLTKPQTLNTLSLLLTM